MKSLCSRALKNFSSQDHNPDGALEEGTVAALIALSLEGKSSDTPDSDRVEEPTVVMLQESAHGPPSDIDEVQKIEPNLWFVELEVIPGGPAGPLLETPDPPAPEAETPEEQARQLRNISFQDAEGQTNMAFAKLSVPRSIANKYTLTDEDFNMVRINDVASVSSSSRQENGDAATTATATTNQTKSTAVAPATQESKPARQEQQPPATAPESHGRSRGISEPPRSVTASYDSFNTASYDEFTPSRSGLHSPIQKNAKRKDSRKNSTRSRSSSKSPEYDLGIHAAELGLWTN